MTTMATFETEIRKLQPVELCTLAQYLDESNYWKKLMAIVPKGNDENVHLFRNEHFRMIEQAIHQQKRSGAEIFLSEWSTLNRKRPTCKLLLDLLVKIQFFKAADYLAVDVLKIDPPERPKQGPGAPVDISDEMLEKQLMEMVNMDTDTETDQSYSVRYVEKPVELIPVQAEVQPEKIAPQISYPDMIVFSETAVTRSDMMKFSEDDLKKLPDQMSSIMKVDADNAESSLSAYGLPVADSGLIPVCVNDSESFSNDENTGNLSTATQSTIPSSFINDSDSTSPTASESDIPIAVLKCSKNDT